MDETALPQFEDVALAARRIDGQARPTPMLRSDVIDDLVGKSVWFKPECLQKVGAFKYRGAFNRLSAMTATERAQGVVAFSSGNHAQGVSRAAKELGISAVIVMPSDAPRVKVKGVERDGAKIVSYDRATENREAIAEAIASDENRILVPSYDDPYIIAGQGTVGLEIAQEAAENGIDFDGLITCIGGGGLCAGISLALGRLSPQTQIFGAEPAGYDDHQMSLRAGHRVGLTEFPETLCDALATPKPGALTWAINQTVLQDVFDISDRECLLAMAMATQEWGITLEPGGAVAMAAILTGRLDSHADLKTVCVILSGGNVDPSITKRAEAMFGLSR